MRTAPLPPNRRIADIQRELDAAEFVEEVKDIVVFTVSLAGFAAAAWLAAFI